MRLEKPALPQNREWQDFSPCRLKCSVDYGFSRYLTPIRSADRIEVADGRPGPVTRKIQERFLAIIQGAADDKDDWLTFCNLPAGAGKPGGAGKPTKAGQPVAAGR